MDASGRPGLAGSSATAATSGPARDGYGLFLPDMRDEFGPSTEVPGLMESGLHVGYLAALVAMGVATGLLGPAPGSLPAEVASAVLFGSG